MERRETRPPPPPPNPAHPYREDCWSEAETSALVDAWGDRYMELNRGNLRQQHWQEVADAVNSNRTGPRRPFRTDVQCKNRIDTLKKKYKAERARIIESAGALQSQWPFYPRLEALIGPPRAPTASNTTRPSASPPLALPLPYRRKASTSLPIASAVEVKRPKMLLSSNNLISHRARAAAAAAAQGKENSSSNSDSTSSSRSSIKEQSNRGPMGGSGVTGGEADAEGIRDLARAIEKFAEIYEQVECSKQRQLMELEKQRMEFTKALEFERMQIFVDTQIQLAKVRSNKLADSEAYL